MASPTSLKIAPPTPTDTRVRHRFLWLYVLIIWASILPAIIFEVYFFRYFLIPYWTWIVLPWNILGVYYLTVIWATYVAKFFLWWARRFHKPREGVFRRAPDDKDYRSFFLRNLIRKFPIWLLYSTPFPWLKEGWMFRRFGVKVGPNCAIHDAIISAEFVEIGANVIIGHGTVVRSFWFEQDRFIVGRVVIGDNAIIGSHTGLMPWTKIGENAVVDSEAFVLPHSEILPSTFVRGKPAVPVPMKDIPFSE